MANNFIKLSVHQLVDFLLREGDIDNRVFNRSTMNEGTLIHSAYQAKQGNNYLSEYPLCVDMPYEGFYVNLQGRADGIIKVSNDYYIIDEIKTTIEDLKTFRNHNFSWHIGQAKCYAYMFCKQQKFKEIGIRLTYIKQGKSREKQIENYKFHYTELEQYLYSLLHDYFEFYKIISEKKLKRNESISKLEFPYINYRNGQKDLIKYSYAVANKGGTLYCEAPTGIGKTISTIFPSIKNLTENDDAKIFYLTAKNSGKEIARNTMNVLRNDGLFMSSIVITSKDRICLNKNKSCNPDDCPFAKNYYNKIKPIIKMVLLNYNDIDLNLINQIAYDYQVCPFELELDLSLFTDLIICDYNYLFDPTSYMKRYFDEDCSMHIALIDEAHNLVERSRNMYSAILSNTTLNKARKSERHIANRKIKNQLAKINKIFDDIKEKYSEGNSVIAEIPNEYIKSLSSFVTSYQDLNKFYNKDLTKEYRELFLEINHFVKILDFINEHYLLFVLIQGEKIELNITCLDASRYIAKTVSKIKCANFFSATLSPSDYFVDTLGGNKNTNPILKLQSPFPKENFKLLVAPKVSIKYKNRDLTYQTVIDYIHAFINAKIGNYLIYLPSYEYLEKLSKYFDFKNENVFMQSHEMNDIEKAEFLNNFKYSPQKTTLGFVIMGGSFSEGIDLTDDRLIGVVIVGIGLAKVNFISDKIKEYYDSIGESGYKYSYLYPAMNKVTQAVGRVIRSETDKGAALLIDERYTTSDYRNLLKSEWKDYELVFSTSDLEKSLKSFFNK